MSTHVDNNSGDHVRTVCRDGVHTTVDVCLCFMAQESRETGHKRKQRGDEVRQRALEDGKCIGRELETRRRICRCQAVCLQERCAVTGDTSVIGSLPGFFCGAVAGMGVLDTSGVPFDAGVKCGGGGMAVPAEKLESIVWATEPKLAMGSPTFPGDVERTSEKLASDSGWW